MRNAAVVLAASVAFLAAGGSAHGPAIAQAAAASAMLDRLVGTWDGPGTFVDSAYSKAGTADAKTTCAWSNDRQFVICQQHVVMNGKSTDDVAVYTYDAAAQKYHFYNIGPARANATELTVAGDTMTYSDSFTDGSKHVSTRTLNVWSSPKSYTWRAEYSLDGGATWTLMGSGTATRTN
ncbi:MAG TPA: hypothetical protein VIJ77_02995 [Candidatus Tumulicola sp.]